jgi:hypothetical protein
MFSILTKGAVMIVNIRARALFEKANQTNHAVKRKR